MKIADDIPRNKTELVPLVKVSLKIMQKANNLTKFSCINKEMTRLII